MLEKHSARARRSDELDTVDDRLAVGDAIAGVASCQFDLCARATVSRHNRRFAPMRSVNPENPRFSSTRSVSNMMSR